MNEKFEDVFGNFELGHDEKVQLYLDSFDLKSLEKIRKTPLSDLTDDDLLIIGLEKIEHDEFEEIYCCRDFNHVKMYFSKVNGIFELRGYLLKKEKEISTTQELIDEAFLTWRLKMNKKKDG